MPDGCLPVRGKLEKGKVPAELFAGLLEGTHITSSATIDALRRHLVEGMPSREAWESAGAFKSNFYLHLSTLQKASDRVARLAPFYNADIED
ncbi:PapB/FocB family fimbrial expression transcriptional regulator [Pseudomonas putida]|uniref:Na(+)-translocating NADH-quinone reductase subunit C n=1 Tax=Pseudomonas putida TaxID=303 RepID=A0A7V8EJL7_PSEPU|nr:Na(+)-translocating NADH-quinone reductase subunit C [Pseudomonas putida]